MGVRAVRGAISVEQNKKEYILNNTSELLCEMISKNNIDHDSIISIFFTATKDLNSEYPAVAARDLGYTDISLMCMQEMNVIGSMDLCIRVIIHFNTHKSNSDITHIYLKKAQKLRPDLN